MPINKVQTGDLLTSTKWNELVTELNKKEKLSENTFSGALTITESLHAQNAAFSGNLKVNAAEITEGLTAKTATFSGDLKAKTLGIEESLTVKKAEITESLRVNKLTYEEVYGDKISFWGANGWAGIGNTANLLYFNSYGSFSWRNRGTETMNLDENGRLTLHTLSYYSDARLKTNVKNLENALDKLTQLRGVSFEWKAAEKDGADARVQTGMIAQEVEQVFPNWVSEHNGIKTISATGFDGLVVEALKELKQRIVRMEAVLHLAV